MKILDIYSNGKAKSNSIRHRINLYAPIAGSSELESTA